MSRSFASSLPLNSPEARPPRSFGGLWACTPVRPRDSLLAVRILRVRVEPRVNAPLNPSDRTTPDSPRGFAARGGHLTSQSVVNHGKFSRRCDAGRPYLPASPETLRRHLPRNHYGSMVCARCALLARIFLWTEAALPGRSRWEQWRTQGAGWSCPIGGSLHRVSVRSCTAFDRITTGGWSRSRSTRCVRVRWTSLARTAGTSGHVVGSGFYTV